MPKLSRNEGSDFRVTFISNTNTFIEPRPSNSIKLFWGVKDNKLYLFQYLEKSPAFNPYLYEESGEFYYNEDNNWNYLPFIHKVTEVNIETPIYQTSYVAFFKGFSALTTINGIENIHTDNAVSTARMFEGCGSLTTLNLSSFRMKGIYYLNDMFSGCENLEHIYVDPARWKISSMSESDRMFSGCASLPNFDGDDTVRKAVLIQDGGYLESSYVYYWAITKDGCLIIDETPFDVSSPNYEEVGEIGVISLKNKEDIFLQGIVNDLYAILEGEVLKNV